MKKTNSFLEEGGGGNIGGNIYDFLAQGYCFSDIAKKIKKSRAWVLKKANKYVVEGKLERVNKYPALFQIPKRCYPPPRASRQMLPLPAMIPAKFGAIFAVTKTGTLRFDKHGKAYVKTALFSAQIGRNKAQIWLRGGFTGTTIEEQIQSGQFRLMQISEHLMDKFKVEMALLRFYEGIEWIDADTDRSKKIAKSAEIPKGGSVEIGGAIHKFGDFSHPEQIQFNPKHGGNQKIPTEHAQVHEYIYSGKLANDLYALGDSIKKLWSKIEEKH